MTYSRSSVPDRTLLVGCGQVGSQLGEQLITAGSQVAALRRNPSQLPSTFTRLAVDLLQPTPDTLPEVDAMVVTFATTMPDPGGLAASCTGDAEHPSPCGVCIVHQSLRRSDSSTASRRGRFCRTGIATW